jgi:hypothetical protein
MVKDTMSPKPMAVPSSTAARLSLGAVVTFLVLLAALHLIKPELDPSWHFISEYAIGDYGWLMALAFCSLAFSFIALFFALRSHLQTIVGRIGLALLWVSAAGLIIAGIFTTDPITTSPEAMTTRGLLHNLGGTLGIAIPFAAAFISWGLARHPAWASARQPIIGAAGLAWIGFLVAIGSLSVMLSRSNGVFGPGVLVGWPNRLEMVTYCVWLMVVAWQTIRQAKA